MIYTHSIYYFSVGFMYLIGLLWFYCTYVFNIKHPKIILEADRP